MRFCTVAAMTLLLVGGTVGGAKADAIVGVHFGSNGKAPTNWTLVSTTNSPLENLIDEDGNETDIGLDFGAPAFESFYAGSLADSTIPMHTPSLAALKGNTYDSSFSGLTFTATFSGLDPDEPYAVWVFGARFDPGIGINQHVTISGAETVEFDQSGVGNSLWINDTVGSSDNDLESYAEVVTSTPDGTITITATGFIDNPFGDTYSVSGLAIQSAN